MPLKAWLDAFMSCHNFSGLGGIIQWAWPNGLGYVDQPAIVVQVFSVLRSEASRIMAEKGKKHG